MKLIDKDKVVAEIERRKNQFVSQAESFHKIGKEDKESYYAALASNMNSLSCFLDTLEVKEVNSTDAFIKKARKYFYKELPNFRSFMESGTAFIKNFESFIQGE